MSIFKPIRDRLVVKPLEHEKTKSGLYRASNVEPTEGKVVAVGPGILLAAGSFFPLSVEVGQVVVYQAGAGVQLDADGDKYLVLNESDVLVIKEVEAAAAA